VFRLAQVPELHGPQQAPVLRLPALCAEHLLLNLVPIRQTFLSLRAQPQPSEQVLQELRPVPVLLPAVLELAARVLELLPGALELRSANGRTRHSESL